MSKHTTTEKRIDVIKDAYITTLQVAYDEYKKELIKDINMTHIGNDGLLFVYGGGNWKALEEARDKVKEARENLCKYIKEESNE